MSKADDLRKKLGAKKSDVAFRGNKYDIDSKTRIAIKKIGGEWVAAVYRSNKFDDNASFYSGGADKDAKLDAIATGKAMAAHFNIDPDTVTGAASQKPARHVEPVDAEALRELELFVDNTAALYPKKLAIQQLLFNKMQKGTFDKSKAWKAWLYLIDEGARLYAKEIGRETKFPPALRAQAAQDGVMAWGERLKAGDEGEQAKQIALKACGCKKHSHDDKHARHAHNDDTELRMAEYKDAIKRSHPADYIAMLKKRINMTEAEVARDVEKEIAGHVAPNLHHGKVVHRHRNGEYLAMIRVDKGNDRNAYPPNGDAFSWTVSKSGGVVAKSSPLEPMKTIEGAVAHAKSAIAKDMMNDGPEDYEKGLRGGSGINPHSDED